MGKRFTDTDKYKKPFYRGLSSHYKILWDYIYHSCDHAGIWIKDFEVARVYMGADVIVNEKKALELFNKDEQRILVVGARWFVIPFIKFQYKGELNPNNKVHQSAIKLLEELKINYNELSKFKSAEATEQPKETKATYHEFVKLTKTEYNKLVSKYGENRTEKMIELLANYKGSTGKKYQSDYRAILNWVHERVPATATESSDRTKDFLKQVLKGR